MIVKDHEGDEFVFDPTEQELGQIREDLLDLKDFSKSSLWVERLLDKCPFRIPIRDLTTQDGKPFKAALKELLKLP
jgi:hypothetical protein